MHQDNSASNEISEFSDVTFPRIKFPQISPWYVHRQSRVFLQRRTAKGRMLNSLPRACTRRRTGPPCRGSCSLFFSLPLPPSLSLSLSFSGCFATSSLMRIGKTGGWEERRYDCADVYNFVRKDFVNPSALLGVHLALIMAWFEVPFASNKNKT